MRHQPLLSRRGWAGTLGLGTRFLRQGGWRSAAVAKALARSVREHLDLRKLSVLESDDPENAEFDLEEVSEDLFLGKKICEWRDGVAVPGDQIVVSLAGHYLRDQIGML